jgi:hypothetical protein
VVHKWVPIVAMVLLVASSIMCDAPTDTGLHEEEDICVEAEDGRYVTEVNGWAYNTGWGTARNVVVWAEFFGPDGELLDVDEDCGRAANLNRSRDLAFRCEYEGEACATSYRLRMWSEASEFEEPPSTATRSPTAVPSWK